MFDREKCIASMTVIKYVNDNYLKIADISEFSNSKYINKGIGSMMMKELLSYAKSLALKLQKQIIEMIVFMQQFVKG